MLVNKLKSRLQFWMTALHLRISAAVILMLQAAGRLVKQWQRLFLLTNSFGCS